MELTGKCKESFEKWLLNNITYNLVDNVVEWFYEQPQSMKCGVYVDFFQSIDKKFQVYVAPYFNHDLGIMNEWGAWAKGVYTGSFEEIESARTAAIEKANEIFNNK